jgi:hypothetical protein
MGERPSGLEQLWDDYDHRCKPDPQWHILGDLVIQFSRKEMIFEVWETFLRRSQRLPGSPNVGIIKELSTSLIGNVVVALCTDFKVYAWRNLV